MAETISATDGSDSAMRYISGYKAKYSHHRSFLAEIRKLELSIYD
jgi:hypothetical protein